MSRENVVPFQRSSRMGMARRGAPDKRQRVFAETIEMECPNCAAVLCFEPSLLGQPEILCAGCDALIPLGIPGRADLG